ncbi:MAG TPA: TonB-dependent receptor plug domain-containing protein, partial [Gammaproteobacteria bacterium]|nr:TonB-dependent receptor plug domain-containing protein [Gammaproteobacteria bacterium]
MAETSPRRARLRFGWSAAALFVLAASPASAQRKPETAPPERTDPQGIAASAPAPGTRIIDYVTSLRAAGYDIIYSDALLTPAMRVEAEPPSGDALTRLEEVLAPHGLALRRGPRRTWLVVMAAPDRERPRPQAPPRAVPSASEIESIIVTASRYSLERQSVAAPRTLSQTDLTDLPTLGEDALRATRVLPGLSGSGVGAKFHARGGETDETLLFLDGVRLYDPYHLKDFQSLFSSIAPRMLDSVEVLTGGYPADFGDRMSAVVEMQSRTPVERRHYEVGASTLTTSVLSSGRFGEDRGSWLASMRRGNLDLIANAAENDFGRPTYGDLFGKIGYTFDSGVTATAGSLLVNDRISLRDPGSATAGADYDDGYIWLAVDDDRGGKLAVRYLLSHTLLDDGRDGVMDDPDLGAGVLLEKRRFESSLVKADASFAVSARQALRFGAELERMSARYRFEATGVPAVPVDLAALEPGAAAASVASGTGARSARAALDGQQQAVYLAYRVQPIARLTAEVGL